MWQYVKKLWPKDSDKKNFSFPSVLTVIIRGRYFIEAFKIEQGEWLTNRRNIATLGIAL